MTCSEPACLLGLRLLSVGCCYSRIDLRLEIRDEALKVQVVRRGFKMLVMIKVLLLEHHGVVLKELLRRRYKVCCYHWLVGLGLSQLLFLR